MLGKGSALGSDVDPRPFGAAAESRAGLGAPAGGAVRHDESATMVARAAIDERIVRVCLRYKSSASGTRDGAKHTR